MERKFMTLYHHEGSYFKFEADMIAHKPGSPTFSAWVGRYIEAYNYVERQSSSLNKGTVAMMNVNNGAIAVKSFGSKVGLSNLQKADAVRTYLKSHGGVMEIEVHDIPGIGTSGATPKHVERLLLFDCGMAGVAGPRVTAMQYLNHDSANPAASQREFKISSFARMTQPDHGLREIPAPSSVSFANPTMVAGEYR
jgi:hypothetical protein